MRDEIRRRLAPLRLDPARESSIVEELAQHVEDRYRERRAAGASEAEAHAEALKEIDEADVLRREVARVEGAAPIDLPAPGAVPRGPWARTLWHDARYTARTLRRSPGFSLTVLLAMALSIGPVTAIVSVGNWLLWRPHPGVTDPGSLATVWFGQWRDTGGVSPSGVSYDNIAHLLSRARTFSAMAGAIGSSAGVSTPGGVPRLAPASIVTANFFEVLGVRLRAGRGFLPEEDRPPFGAPVTVIGEQLARLEFGSPESAVGKVILLNSRPFSVVGVAPAAFEGTSTTSRTGVWITGATLPFFYHVKTPQAEPGGPSVFYEFFVRKAPGSRFEEVEAELKVLARQLVELSPDHNQKFETVTARLYPGLGLPVLTRASTGAEVNTMLAVGVVLLVLGCANVGNLLVFRASHREHEMAVRKALGASRARLMQLQLAEGWVLALAGAAIGLALAVILKQLIQRLMFPAAPGFSLNVPIDGRVLAATTLTALLTGTLAAVVPAWLASRGQAVAALGRAGRSSTRAPSLRGGLAVLQLALSLVLLVNALLLITTLRNLRGVDLGFDPDGIAVTQVDLSTHGYDEPRSLGYHRQLLGALQAGGFVRSAASDGVPFGSSSRTRIVPQGGDPASPVTVRYAAVSPNYFEILSIPLTRGRAFIESEAMTSAGAEMPIVINETLARQLFGGLDVLGRTMTFPRTAASPTREASIVGVVADSRRRIVTNEPNPFVYLPFNRGRAERAFYLIPSELPVDKVGSAANAIAARVAPSIPLSPAWPLMLGIDQELSRHRLFAWMLGLLAALGFVLASVGLYGLVAQTVTDRQREFGIRLAIGASTRDIIRLVARYALIVAALGLMAGLAGGYAGTRLVESMLFGVSRLDPRIYLGAATALLIVVALASAVPMLRAVRVPPVDVLRSE